MRDELRTLNTVDHSELVLILLERKNHRINAMKE